MFINKIINVVATTSNSKKLKIVLLLLEIAIVAFAYNEAKERLEDEKSKEKYDDYEEIEE